MNAATEIFAGLFGGFFYGLTGADIAMAFGCLLWFVLLCVPLHGEYLDSVISAANYMAFSAFAGLLLVFVVPVSYVGTFPFKVNISMAGVFASVGGLRWLVGALRHKRHVEAQRRVSRDERASKAE